MEIPIKVAYEYGGFSSEEGSKATPDDEDDEDEDEKEEDALDGLVDSLDFDFSVFS